MQMPASNSVHASIEKRQTDEATQGGREFKSGVMASVLDMCKQGVDKSTLWAVLYLLYQFQLARPTF